jgi:ubiquinol-cytochrome c reductase iron-sulfur subunit
MHTHTHRRSALIPPLSLLRSYDESVHQRYPVGDPTKRAFTYFVMTGGRFIYASAIRLAVLKFVLSMSATADVLALASLEVDLGKIEPGQTVTVKWRGKPVFIRRRTATEIAREAAVPIKDLRDAQADSERVVNPEWLIVVGVCTHLGCVPLPGAGDYNGWFCPWCVARLRFCVLFVCACVGAAVCMLRCWRACGMRLRAWRVARCALHARAVRIRIRIRIATAHALTHPLSFPFLSFFAQPRQPLRRVWPHPQGPRAVQPGGARVQVSGRKQSAHRLNHHGTRSMASGIRCSWQLAAWAAWGGGGWGTHAARGAGEGGKGAGLLMGGRCA